MPLAYPGEPVFYVVEQLAQLWQMSVMTVYRQLHEGELPAIRIGDPGKGRLIVPQQAVEPEPDRGQAPPLRRFHRLGATARFVGVSYGLLNREVQAGRFPAVRMRSIWLVPTAAINAMIAAAFDSDGVVLASDFGDWADRRTATRYRAAEPAEPADDQVRTLPTTP